MEKHVGNRGREIGVAMDTWVSNDGTGRTHSDEEVAQAQVEDVGLFARC